MFVIGGFSVRKWGLSCRHCLADGGEEMVVNVLLLIKRVHDQTKVVISYMDA